MSLQKPDLKKVLEGAEATMEDLDQLHKEQKAEETEGDYSPELTTVTFGTVSNLLYAIRKAVKDYSEMHWSSANIEFKKGSRYVTLRAKACIQTKETNEKKINKIFSDIFFLVGHNKQLVDIQKEISKSYPDVKVVSVTAKAYNVEV